MSRGATFVGRVARAMAAAAVLSAIASAALTSGIAFRAAVRDGDRRLDQAAQTLGVEVPAKLTDAEAAAHADDEQREVAPAGLRIALFTGSRRLGGDASLDASHARECRDDGAWRRCSVGIAGGRVVEVAGPRGPLRAQASALAAASLLAALVAGLGGVALSGRVSSRIVRPLRRLRDDVAAVDVANPGASWPAVDDGHAEIDALRDAVGGMLGRLDAALAQSQRFAADAAHELRTPLGALRAELELAAEEPGIPPELRAAQHRATEQVRSLALLVERLLILAAPDDTLRASREAVALGEVVEDSLAALGATPRVRTELDDAAHVRGDAVLLRALVDNLVTNALKFAPDGEVTVRVAADPDAVTVRVEDHGPGFDASERERVFEAFYRSPQARAGGVRGHGLGLALVHRIAAAHGGRACVADVPRGACVVVTLPRWRPSA